MMNYKIKKYKIYTFTMLLLVYIMLIFSYILIQEKFYYQGYSLDFFSYKKLLLSLFLYIVLISMNFILSDKFYLIIYNSLIILVYLGQSIYYIFNDSYEILLIYLFISMLCISLMGIIGIKKIFVNKSKVNINRLLFILTIVLCIPFFKNINSINFKNLFLIDIYDSRDNTIGGLMGYISYPLSRVFIPFIAVNAIKNKDVKKFIISLLLAGFVFLTNGALKSLLFGFVISIILYRDNYIKKLRYILKLLFSALFIANILQYFTDNIMLNDYLRRIFFVPPLLFDKYYEVFNENYTLYLHTRISKLLGVCEYNYSIPHYIGDYMNKPGMSANVGILQEGFFSYGFLGVMIATICLIIIIEIFRHINIDEAYYGIIFQYLYILNTAFLETSLITHGLLILMITSYLVMRKNQFKELNTDHFAKNIR